MSLGIPNFRSFALRQLETFQKRINDKSILGHSSHKIFVELIAFAGNFNF
jgi:hypothetical protein